MIKKRYLKFSIILCLCFGVFFAIFPVIFYFGDWNRATLVFFWGVFVGALALPGFEKNAVKKPEIFQTTVGTAGGFVAALVFTSNLEYILAGSIIGAILGFTAPFWLEYVNIP
jgi:hypothetical protein